MQYKTILENYNNKKIIEPNKKKVVEGPIDTKMKKYEQYAVSNC